MGRAAGTRARASRDARRGFTILELLVALVLIALVATLAIPAYFNRSEVSLENAAVLLARDLRAAQNRAAFSGAPVRVRFDVAGDAYFVTAEGDGLGGTDQIRRTYPSDAVFEGVEIRAVRLGAGDVLVFGPDGMPDPGGEVELSYLGDQRVVRIDARSGTIHVDGSTSGYGHDRWH